MKEADFWQQLEYRLCREFATVRLPEAPGLWCDGLIPEERSLDADPAYVAGRAWIAGLPGQDPARHQEQWRFLLRIRRRGSAAGPLSWSELLPNENARGWVHVSVVNQELIMDLDVGGGAH